MADIADLRRRYVRTAELGVRAGFAGVQIHAAHGYLLSQFLSPIANRRTDSSPCVPMWPIGCRPGSRNRRRCPARRSYRPGPG